MYNELAKVILEASIQDKPSRGVAGGENSNGVYAIRVDDEPNQIYVRLQSGDRETQIEAINLNVPISPDYPVLIYYIPGQKLPNAIVDPARESAYRVSNEGLSTVAPHSHEPGQGNYDPVSTIRMREGQLSVSEPYSMVIDISGLKYLDTDRHEQWFSGGSIDLTAYLPVTADTHKVIKVSLSRIDGSLALFDGVELPLTVPLGEENLADIVIPDSYMNLAGVILYYGMTAVDDMKYIVDWRFWINDMSSGESSSGVTGSVGELADLSDVTTASQTANFILAAGNGSIGGQYNGRLLVPADIPALAASKITSGVFPYTRGGLNADVSAYDGLVKISGSTTSYVKLNTTTTDPTTGDDSGDGYVIGSRWINTSTDEEFVATDVTVGAALWVSTTNTSGLNDLADLDDVSAAAQTANFVLAAGDGATGGDYRGRLLVAADIPNISASKITSGVLAAARGGLNADASAFDGYVRMSGGSATYVKLTVSASDPTTSDDSDDGYVVGSRWINTVSQEEFVCIAATVGNALWISTTATVSGIYVTTADPTVTDDGSNGYNISDHWINTVTPEEFVCLDNTNGAAVWQSTTAFSTTAPIFHGVRDTGSVTISSGGPIEILVLDNYPTGYYDTDSYETSTTELTVPTDLGGYYHITMAASITTAGITGTNAGTYYADIYLNGATILEYGISYFSEVLGMFENRISFSIEEYLSAGDVLSFRVASNTSDDSHFDVKMMMNLIGT